MRRLQASMTSPQPFHAECRVVWPDGGVHWIRLHGTTAYEVGPPRGMTGIVVDITPERTAEAARATAERLEAENRRILEATRAKSLFLATMSHELRTPLNAIIGFADVLASGAVPAGSPKHEVFLGHIQSSGQHLLQLINDVLDLSKVEAGKLEFFPEPVELPALVGEVADLLHTQILQKRLQVRVDVEAGLDGLVLDASRLKQVLLQLPVERHQVHARGADASSCGRGPRARRGCASRSRTPASASRPTTSSGCSPISPSSTAASPSSTRAPASAWR